MRKFEITFMTKDDHIRQHNGWYQICDGLKCVTIDAEDYDDAWKKAKNIHFETHPYPYRVKILEIE